MPSASYSNKRLRLYSHSLLFRSYSETRSFGQVDECFPFHRNYSLQYPVRYCILKKNNAPNSVRATDAANRPKISEFNPNRT